jgi:hypothetical protein
MTDFVFRYLKLFPRVTKKSSTIINFITLSSKNQRICYHMFYIKIFFTVEQTYDLSWKDETGLECFMFYNA